MKRTFCGWSLPGPLTSFLTTIVPLVGAGLT